MPNPQTPPRRDEVEEAKGILLVMRDNLTYSLDGMGGTPSARLFERRRDALTVLLTALSAAEGKLTKLEDVYRAACDWFNYGPPHQLDETDPGSIVTPEGRYEPMTQALSDAIDKFDWAIEFPDDSVLATPGAGE